MSMIGSTGGIDPNQADALQRTRPDGGSRANGARAPKSPEERAERMWSRLESAAGELGMDTEALNQLQGEVRGAVISAMESLGENASAGERRAAVQNALSSTLAENGIDADALMTQLEVSHGRSRGAGRTRGEIPPTEEMTIGVGHASESTTADTLSELFELFPLVDENA